MLVHCSEGKSRSVALVVSYLVSRRRMQLTQALALLRCVGGPPHAHARRACVHACHDALPSQLERIFPCRLCTTCFSWAGRADIDPVLSFLCLIPTDHAALRLHPMPGFPQPSLH